MYYITLFYLDFHLESFDWLTLMWCMMMIRYLIILNNSKQINSQTNVKNRWSNFRSNCIKNNNNFNKNKLYLIRVPHILSIKLQCYTNSIFKKPTFNMIDFQAFSDKRIQKRIPQTISSSLYCHTGRLFGPQSVSTIL